MKQIEVINLVKDYGHGRGVFDVSFDVSEGETFGFLGPNGAGKTTTIRHIMGFSRPQSGRTLVLGKDSADSYAEIMSRVGYLPGEVALPSGLNGDEFLAMMKAMRKAPVDRSKELLARFDLNTKSKLKSMSFGDKRKMAIVTAFMHDPDILVLDEPTSGLDPLMQKTFIEFVREEKARGKTILLSSHIFREVDATCDRISIIKSGKIVDNFVAADYKNAVKKQYDVVFADEEQFSSFCGLPFDFTYSDKEKRRVRVCITGDADALIAALADRNVVSFSVDDFSLEDHFMRFYDRSEDFAHAKK